MKCKSNNSSIQKGEYELNEPFNNLHETGRLQYFYHSPSSFMPIRDVLNEQKQGHKKEPHIEVGAENYWVGCYQSNNIKPFIKNHEKYLFLMTTCRNKQLEPFYGKKYIVGYILRKSTGKRNGLYFIKGDTKDTKLFSFNDAIPITELGYSKWTRTKLIKEKDTKKIIDHFEKCNPILKECILEIKRLDKDNITCVRIKEGRKCDFKDECLRWNIR
jgi:hypothetical protein